MKVLNKKIAIALFFMFSLILPMGISVVHAFHQHENITCLAKNESHFHSEEPNCEDLHYFSQTLNVGDIRIEDMSVDRLFVQNEYYSEFTLIHSFSKSYPNRGPPVIIVF